ncbi:MAG TPA: hypothetical protein VNC61_04035 [Acidimicrobiales bacterium]|nr:hypothetical protein [Acidimicrobiales bacterium]
MKSDATSTSGPALRRKVGGSLTALGAVAAVGVIAAACGSSSPSASTTPTTIARSPAGPSAATTKPASAGQTVVNAESNTTIGRTILVDPSGMTLYTLSADTGGRSRCSGTCATAWPPLTVASGVTPEGGTGTGAGAGGKLATTARSDGSLQVTYDGRPLYTFAGDGTAGATNGNGIRSFGGTWAVVKIGSATSTGSSGTTAPTTTTTTSTPSRGYGY